MEPIAGASLCTLPGQASVRHSTVDSETLLEVSILQEFLQSLLLTPLAKMMKSRQSVVYPKQKKAKRTPKECDLGKNCPYKNEYQHQLEYSHSLEREDIQREKTFAARGNKLGGTKTGTSRLARDVADYGQPTVATLGGSRPTSRLLSEHEASLASRVHSGRTGVSSSSSSGEHTEMFCEMCFKMVPGREYPTHMRSHDQSVQRSGLRAHQDLEYENSVLADIQKSEDELALKARQREEERAAQEAEALKTVMEESRQAAEAAALLRDIANLLPEPDVSFIGPTVRIRFTVPTGTRLVRVFRVENSIQDTFAYLSSVAECRPFLLDHLLRDAVGSLTLRLGVDHGTFASYGITSSCSLLLAPDLSSSGATSEAASETTTQEACKDPMVHDEIVPQSVSQDTVDLCDDEVSVTEKPTQRAVGASGVEIIDLT